MKTFNEWLISEIKYEKPELNNVTDFETILQDLSHKDCVRVALYCAEDVSHLTQSQEAQTCIDLVKKWLEDETSVTKKELKTATDAASTAAYSAASSADVYAASSSAAIYAASSAAAAAYWTVHDTSYTASATVNAADWAAAVTQKTNKYLAYARQFAQNYHDPNYQDSAVKGKLPYLDYGSENILNDVNLFLSVLQDEYTDRDVYNKDNFIFNPENFTLRLPTGYEISGKNRDELIQNIAKSRFAINYLNRMYNT